MPVCRVCKTQKGLFDFPDDTGGEADTCIDCGRAETGAIVRQLNVGLDPRGEMLLRHPNAARLQKVVNRVRSMEKGLPAAPRVPKPTVTQRPAVKSVSSSDTAADELARALEEYLESMRLDIEKSVRAEVEKRAPKPPPKPKLPNQPVGFRVVAFDEEGLPIRFEQLQKALQRVEVALRMPGVPPLVQWHAWVNGAWVSVQPKYAQMIALAIKESGIPGVELFTGYPEDFFINAVPV